MKYLYKISLAVLACTALTQCKKPTDGVQLTFNADVMQYVVSMQFYDAANPSNVPANINVTFSGNGAASVYEIGGTQVYKVNNGKLALGIAPSAVPTQGKPVEFVAEITAPGYMPVKLPVTVLLDQKQQMKMVGMVSISTPPKGASVATKTQALGSNGTTTAATTISTPSTNGKQENATITMPAGTSFYDAAGNQLTGSSVEVTMIHFDTRNAASINAFPGGLLTKNLTDENNNNVSGVFSTAGFASIDMSVGGQDVKKFNQPIGVAMGIDENQTNPTTGVAIKAGDMIPVWSYQSETGKWRFESNQTVVVDNGKLTLKFETSHLTWFNMGWVNTVCPDAKVKFNVSGTDKTDNYIVDVYAQNNPTHPLFTGTLAIANGQEVPFSGMPSNSNVIVNVYSLSAGNSPSDWKVRDVSTKRGSYTGSVCGTLPGINVTVPASQPAIVFNLWGKCPKGLIIKPTAPVWFRSSGSNEVYQYLGMIDKGTFSTINLSVGKSYDFSAIYNNKEYKVTRTVTQQSYQGEQLIPDGVAASVCPN